MFSKQNFELNFLFLKVKVSLEALMQTLHALFQNMKLVPFWKKKCVAVSSTVYISFFLECHLNASENMADHKLKINNKAFLKILA